jgi:hypothetical protein
MEETMKTSSLKGNHRISLFFFLLVTAVLLIASPSGDALENGATIGANAFQPATMILLGSALIGLAGWGLRKIRK